MSWDLSKRKINRVRNIGIHLTGAVGGIDTDIIAHNRVQVDENGIIISTDGARALMDGDNTETSNPGDISLQNLATIVGIKEKEINDIQDQQRHITTILGALFSLMTPGSLNQLRESHKEDIKKCGLLNKLMQDAEGTILARNISNRGDDDDIKNQTKRSGKNAQATQSKIPLSSTTPPPAVTSPPSQPSPSPQPSPPPPHLPLPPQPSPPSQESEQDMRNAELDHRREQLDKERRKRNVIFKGLTENRNNTNDQQFMDERTARDILRVLESSGRINEIEKVSRIGRLGGFRRHPRLLKVDFKTKEAANEILDKAPRLFHDRLYSRDFIQKDLTIAERTILNSRRNTYNEVSGNLPPARSSNINNNNNSNSITSSSSTDRSAAGGNSRTSGGGNGTNTSRSSTSNSNNNSSSRVNNSISNHSSSNIDRSADRRNSASSGRNGNSNNNSREGNTNFLSTQGKNNATLQTKNVIRTQNVASSNDGVDKNISRDR